MISCPTLKLDKRTSGLLLNESPIRRSWLIFRLLFENDRYIPNFQQKADIFNAYFADHCNIYDNGSALPVSFSRANASLSHVNITHNQIDDIIQKCSAKKALGCDEILIAMLHLCASEVAYPLRLIFQKCMTSGKFPDSWKYANVVPIHKKGNHQLKLNY